MFAIVRAPDPLKSHIAVSEAQLASVLLAKRCSLTIGSSGSDVVVVVDEEVLENSSGTARRVAIVYSPQCLPQQITPFWLVRYFSVGCGELAECWGGLDNGDRGEVKGGPFAKGIMIWGCDMRVWAESKHGERALLGRRIRKIDLRRSISVPWSMPVVSLHRQ